MIYLVWECTLRNAHEKKLFRSSQPFALMGQISNIDTWFQEDFVQDNLQELLPDWIDLLQKLLQADPNKRFHSASDLIHQLQRIPIEPTNQLRTLLSETPCFSSLKKSSTNNKKIIGRSRDFQNIEKLIDTSDILWIHGRTGIGKTYLLQKIFRSLPPDDSCWIDMSVGGKWRDIFCLSQDISESVSDYHHKITVDKGRFLSSIISKMLRIKKNAFSFSILFWAVQLFSYHKQQFPKN